MININLEIRGMRKILDELTNAASESQLSKANSMAGTVLVDFIGKWYDNKGRDHWLNKSLPTHGPGRQETGWYSHLAWGWMLIAADHTGALVAFPDEDGSLRHKIYGGTITPKRAQALTIPLVPEAHGRGIWLFVATVQQ